MNFKFAKHIMNVKKVRKNVHVLVENRMNIATSGHVHIVLLFSILHDLSDGNIFLAEFSTFAGFIQKKYCRGVYVYNV